MACHFKAREILPGIVHVEFSRAEDLGRILSLPLLSRGADVPLLRARTIAPMCCGEACESHSCHTRALQEERAKSSRLAFSAGVLIRASEVAGRGERSVTSVLRAVRHASKKGLGETYVIATASDLENRTGKSSKDLGYEVARALYAMDPVYRNEAEGILEELPQSGIFRGLMSGLGFRGRHGSEAMTAYLAAEGADFVFDGLGLKRLLGPGHRKLYMERALSFNQALHAAVRRSIEARDDEARLSHRGTTSHSKRGARGR